MSGNAVEGAAVVLERHDGVGIVRLNRPARLNTLDFELAGALLDALQEAAADATIRVVLLTGAGRSFQAGADLSLFQRDFAQAPDVAGRLIDTVHAAIALMRSMPKPVVAALQGSVAGGGLAVATACDLAIAADNCVLVSAYTRIGATPDCGTTWSLTHLLGPRRALEMMWLNEPIDAARALALGLVNRVVPAGELEAAALQLAQKLAAGAAGSNASVKRLVNDAAQSAFRAHLDAEKQSFVDAAGGAEFREGVSAFFERRPARF